MKDTFSTCHPAVNFLYFTLVLLFSMFFMHPICLGISLLCAFCYSVSLNGKKALGFLLKYMIPLLILTALINPAFNHEGGTILAYFRDGNPLTLESLSYGIGAAVMLITVVCWFSCYNAVMTSDKFLYLFGRVFPALSLVLSMTLRFVPRFKAQLTAIANAQRGIGRDLSSGSLLRRAKNGIKILSILVTWALENAIETADSMKSRGYGLKGRTAFSLYRFGRRDKSAMLFLLLCGGYLVCGAVTGGLSWRYFPTMKGVGLAPYPLSLFFCYLSLCLTPIAINRKEGRKWKATQSRI